MLHLDTFQTWQKVSLALLGSSCARMNRLDWFLVVVRIVVVCVLVSYHLHLVAVPGKPFLIHYEDFLYILYLLFGFVILRVSCLLGVVGDSNTMLIKIVVTVNATAAWKVWNVLFL